MSLIILFDFNRTENKIIPTTDYFSHPVEYDSQLESVQFFSPSPFRFFFNTALLLFIFPGFQ